MIEPALTPIKTKVSIIREEYVSITDRFEHALILNQFVYWSERVRDFDQFILEENKKKDDHGLQEEMQEPTHGWIYKTAQQLSEELMTGWSPATVGRHIKPLIDLGFLEVRQNPKYRWNQTKQYRVNLNAVGEALHKKGYSIPGYTLTHISKAEPPVFKMKTQKIEMKNVPYTETINKGDDVAPETQIPPQPETKKPSPSSSNPKQKQTTAEAPTSTPGDIETALMVLCALIPESMRKPSVIAKLSQAIENGLTLELIKSCIKYSNDKSHKKTWQAYRSHLGQCLDKKWGEGYSGEAMEDTVLDEKKILQERLKMPVEWLKMDAGQGNRYSQRALEIIKKE